MLRCKGRDRLELELFLWRADRIANSEDTWVKHTDYISCIGFVDYLSFLSHYLLRLRKSELFIALNVENFHILIELARTDTQESDTVTVSLVHISLYLEYESRELRVERIYDTGRRISRSRRSCHFEEVFQKRLDAEVCKSRAKEHRRKLTLSHLFDIKLIACAIEKLDIIAES